ncbi:MAG: M23 family metallopeptidase [Clostridia bacterium]|nr:M23 family metallopeptidase [Clostridia bacterium]
MLSFFYKYLYILLFITILICIFFIPFFEIDNSSFSQYTNNNFVFSSYNFVWPIPGYTNISSPFGKRSSPTSGASTYHSGIDIPAPEGTKLYAIDNGTVTFASWGAGGGYTITYQLDNYPDIKISYCHVSPIILVSLRESIHKGQVIGSVGPKNVYGIINNPYKDSNGNPTNGASTGCHLHFTIKYNNTAVNPLNYYDL